MHKINTTLFNATTALATFSDSAFLQTPWGSREQNFMPSREWWPLKTIQLNSPYTCLQAYAPHAHDRTPNTAEKEN